MFSFFRKKPDPAPSVAGTVADAAATPLTQSVPEAAPAVGPAARTGWMARLRQGLQRTGAGIAGVFTRTRVDEALYEDLETALLMADAGVAATEHLLQDLRKRVRARGATEPQAVRALLVDALTELLLPLQRPLQIGPHKPTVLMITGVNGAGKTTTIGKLTRHLADAGATVLLAAADTFRAAAREQLGAWATRAGAAEAVTVEILSQQGADPAAVSYDAVSAGRARGRDVVLVDTAGRLTTQAHLMDELKKIQRVIQKALDSPASDGTPSGLPSAQVLLVIDGNTGQNALAQVKAFDDALRLGGLIVTKLDGTAKGGVLAAIARERPMPVYFIGVGEQLEDLQTFDAREFAQALLG